MQNQFSQKIINGSLKNKKLIQKNSKNLKNGSFKNEFNKITENQENLISVEEEDHKIKEEYKNDSFNALANRPFYLELVEMNDLEEAKIYYDELPFLEFRKKIIIFKA